MPYFGSMLATLVPLAGWRIDNSLAPFYISEKYFHFRLFGSERKCVHVLFWNFDVKYLLKYYLKSGDFAYFWNKWKVIFKRDSNIIISSSQTKKMVGSRVYVGGLPFGVRERDLEKFFKGFGRIRDILIKNGYGFVEFDDYRDADDAVYELNGKELLGERVVVEPARGIDRSAERSRRDRHYDRDRGGRSRYEYGPPTRTEYRLVVENLSSRISWQDLKDYMRQAGEVTYADAHKQHRNEGVVEFSSHADMRAAIEKLDGTELNGRRIRLVEDKRSSRRRSRSSSSRSRSRSRSRGRRASRSRSRSRSRSKPRSKTKSPAAKSRSRSRSKDRSRSKSRSGSPDRRRRRSVSRKSDDRPRRSTSRSKSRSPKKSMSKERSRSRSKGASPKQDDRRKSVSKSRSRSRSPRSARSASRDRSVSRGRSRSASPRTNGDANGRNSADRSPRSGD